MSGIFKLYLDSLDDSGFYLNLAFHLLKNKLMKKTKRRSTKTIRTIVAPFT